ncbi:MAG: helix-turn-helix domain-containing protein [Muribaculaceae bacterium]|nr:helix-turn-helix domain-containing protein [Muribaculaceae bacterium]
MSKILRVTKPSDYSAWVGQTDPHELVSVIDYSNMESVRMSLNRYEVYGLFLMGDDASFDLVYGTGQYDYSAGTLICVAPGQLGGKEDTGEFVHLSGWAVLFHPDILQGTGLERDIRSFSFFEYRVSEALHMTPEERDIMTALMRQLQHELQFPSDHIQNRIIVGFINLLLRYSQRFYDRQFVTRKIVNNDVLARFEQLLHKFFENGEQLEKGIPSVQYCAEQLCMSPNYLSDLMKRTTGDTTAAYIKRYVIQLAKNRLASGMKSSEVAYSLGFDYPQHFARLFKNIEGITPSEYVRRRTAVKR